MPRFLRDIDDIPDIPRVGFNRALDFCVWAIQKDGLHVPPFNRHAEGDASLRSLGLDPPLWQRWAQDVAEALERQAIQQFEMNERLRATAERETEALQQYADEVRSQPFARVRLLTRIVQHLAQAFREDRDESVAPYPQSESLGPGSESVGAQLGEMFMYYRTHRRAPRRRYWKSQRVREYLVSTRYQALCSEVEALGQRVSRSVLVCFVNYPGPVIYAASESTVVIGVTNWDVDDAEFERVVVEAIYSCLGLRL